MHHAAKIEFPPKSTNRKETQDRRHQPILNDKPYWCKWNRVLQNSGGLVLWVQMQSEPYFQPPDGVSPLNNMDARILEMKFVSKS